MADPIRVAPEDLHLSAARVEGHGEELHARHAASDSRVAEAAAGVPLGAAAALGAAMTKWQVDSTILTGKIAGHGQAFRGAATSFAEVEEGNTAAVKAVGGQASSASATDL